MENSIHCSYDGCTKLREWYHVKRYIDSLTGAEEFSLFANSCDEHYDLVAAEMDRSDNERTGRSGL